MGMDLDDDIDQTLKDLDDLETDLFKDSLKKVPEKKITGGKSDSPKKQPLKVPPTDDDDDDDFDDDIADLLSDDDDAFRKPKITKTAQNVADETKKAEKKPPPSSSRSFDSLDGPAGAKGSPAHTLSTERDDLSQMTKDLFDKDSYLGFSDFEKGLNPSDSQKNSTFQEDVIPQKKVHAAKEDLDFLSNKAGDLSSQTLARTMEPQKKKDEINFDDSELLDDLGFDDLTAKPSKVRTNPRVSEKRGSFMDDLFGSSKKETNTPTKKQQEFSLDDKYKSAEKKDDADSFGFGGYVPSSAAPSGPTSRRKSVKFEDEPLLPRSGASGSRHKSYSKQDSFLDELLSPVNKPKTSVVQGKGSNEDSSYPSPKIKSISTAGGNPQSGNSPKKTSNPLTSGTSSPLKDRGRNTDWLGFLKEDKEKGQQNSPKHRDLDFLDKSNSKSKDDGLGQRRRSSGADWLGFGKTQPGVKSDDMDHSPAKANVSMPPQQPSILKTADPKSPEQKQVQKQMQNTPLARESGPSSLDQFVSSMKMPPSVAASKSEAVSVLSQQASAVSVIHQDNVASNIPGAGVPAQVMLQNVSANIPSVQQYAAIETQNSFLALQSMINSLQLDKEQLSKSVEALKARHEEEIKALESSQKTQKNAAEESFKNQEKRLKEEFEVKIHNLESQLKDLTKEKEDIIASHKEKTDELKKDHQQEIKRLKDLHSQAVSAMKEDHENALSRLKQLKDQEVEAISSTQVYAKSLQHLTDQLEARASELASLQLKVDDRHQRSLQERQNLLDAKDKELKELKKKLDRQLEESEEERVRLQQLVLRLESRLQQVTKEGEEEKWNLQQTQAKLEIQKKILDEEHNQTVQKIEREKEKLRIAQESLLQEQKAVLLQLAQERQQLSSEKVEMEILAKRLREDETRLQSIRLKEEANKEAERRSLQREKENLEMERARVRQETHRIQIDRDEVERDRRQLQVEKDKLSDQNYNLHRRTQDIEDMSKNAKRMKKEAEVALSLTNRKETDQSAQLEQINQNLSALRAKETQILAEKGVLAEERKLLETKKDSLLCVSCKLSLSRPLSAFMPEASMQPMPPALPFPNIRAVLGIPNPANIDPSLLWWYVTAHKDKEYLTDEQLFLQSLRESSRKKQEFT